MAHFPHVTHECYVFGVQAFQGMGYGTFSACPPDVVEGAKDGMLRWMENYQQQLSAGQFAVGPLIRRNDAHNPGLSEISRSILRFPCRPPLMVGSGAHVSKYGCTSWCQLVF